MLFLFLTRVDPRSAPNPNCKAYWDEDKEIEIDKLSVAQEVESELQWRV